MKIFQILRRLSLLTFVAVTAGPSSFAQDVGADAVVDLPKPAGVRIYPNLPYVENGSPRQKLDLYLPVPVPKEPMPVIVYLHGGGWLKGSRADGRSFAFRMVPHGYAVACVDYRFSSDDLFPAQLEDCKTAVRYLRDNAARYRLDSIRFGVMGVSAGGYLAVMLGATRSTQLFDIGEHLGQSSGVLGVCDFFGPTDLVRFYEYGLTANPAGAAEVTKFLGGDPRIQKLQAQKSNPATYVLGNAPPYLLIHGLNDTVVPPEQSRWLYEVLAKHGVPVHLHLIHEAGHTGPGFVSPEVNAMVEDFFARILKPGTLAQEPVSAFVTESTTGKN